MVAACARPTETTAPSIPTSEPSPIATATRAEPTSTPVPMAAWVNGMGIPAADLEAEIERFTSAQTAIGKQVNPEEARQHVLDDLIDRALLAKAAFDAGFSLDEAGLQARIDHLASQTGGVDNLEKWIQEHGYTDASFREALRLEAAAAWQRDQILDAVPSTGDQAHVRQILVDNQDTAEKIINKLKNGVDFATLALMYDPVAGGDLGWFPKGYLTEPEVENAVFSMQPGQVSGIVQGKLGYHILQVIERDAQHPLSPDALRTQQELALTTWLKDQRDSAKIDLTAP